MTPRCAITDLPVDYCHHCGHHPGDNPHLDPTRGLHDLAGTIVQWSGRDPLHAPMPDLPTPAKRPRRDPECRWVDGYGWYTPAHQATCDDRDCYGCKPCDARHCTCRDGCTEHLPPGVPAVAPACLGHAREHLDAIEQLSSLLIHEAEDAGVDSEAANLAGPTANPHTWSLRKLRAWGTGGVDGLEEDDPHHPLAVLGRWDMLLRDAYDIPTTLTVTIPRARAFLDGQLDRFAQDPDQDFAQLRRELAACRSHLEDVLHDSRTPELGVPCPKCHSARLAKRYKTHDRTGAADEWACAACGYRLTEAEYRLHVGRAYATNADRLPAVELAERLDISVNTIRRWAARRRHQMPGQDPVDLPPLLKQAGRSSDARKAYRVADAQDLHRGWCPWDPPEADESTATA